jgi:hypothetical protein
LTIAHSHLLIAVFFFACRSCEYSKVAVRGRTRLLTVDNINFYSPSHQLCQHDDVTSILSAEYVSVTFVNQKNNKKNEIRTQQRTGDNILCPVLAWANTILRIRTYPTTVGTSTVNSFHDPLAPPGARLRYITQQATNTLLRLTCTSKPPLFFGYTPSNIGSHSIRSGAAMSLFLANEPVHKIMILGRWSSDAFLAYIRPQVQEWTSGMSTNMTKVEDFHIARQPVPPSSTDHNSRHHDDPTTLRNTNALYSTFTPSFNGPNSDARSTPHLHMFH